MKVNSEVYQHDFFGKKLKWVTFEINIWQSLRAGRDTERVGQPDDAAEERRHCRGVPQSAPRPGSQWLAAMLPGTSICSSIHI